MKTLITVICILVLGAVLVALQYGWRSASEGFSERTSMEFAAQAIDRENHAAACGSNAYSFRVISKSAETFVFDVAAKPSSSCPELNVIVDRMSGEVWVGQGNDFGVDRNGVK